MIICFWKEKKVNRKASLRPNKWGFTLKGQLISDLTNTGTSEITERMQLYRGLEKQTLTDLQNPLTLV